MFHILHANSNQLAGATLNAGEAKKESPRLCFGSVGNTKGHNRLSYVNKGKRAQEVCLIFSTPSLGEVGIT